MPLIAFQDYTKLTRKLDIGSNLYSTDKIELKD